MNATLQPGASLGQVAQILRNAILRGPDSWEGGIGPRQDEIPGSGPKLLPTDPDLVELFTLLRERQIPYLLVGGIAMLRYVQGRNTEDIDLLMSLPSLRQLPEIVLDDRNDYFARGRFQSVRVDVLLTANALFAEALRDFGTTHSFAEREVSTATAEGLILLKLYALPSLYRQGLIDRVAVYESDLTSLMQRHGRSVEPLLQRLEKHLSGSDLREIRKIVQEIEGRLARFEELRKNKDAP